MFRRKNLKESLLLYFGAKVYVRVIRRSTFSPRLEKRPKITSIFLRLGRRHIESVHAAYRKVRVGILKRTIVEVNKKVEKKASIRLMQVPRVYRPGSLHSLSRWSKKWLSFYVRAVYLCNVLQTTESKKPSWTGWREKDEK